MRAFLDLANAYNAACVSFLSLSFEISMSDLKDNSRTIENSYIRATNYLNDTSVLSNVGRKLLLHMSNGQSFHLSIHSVLLALCLTMQKKNFAFCY
jgi:hypothetical protein